MSLSSLSPLRLRIGRGILGSSSSVGGGSTISIGMVSCRIDVCEPLVNKSFWRWRCLRYVCLRHVSSAPLARHRMHVASMHPWPAVPCRDIAFSRPLPFILLLLLLLLCGADLGPHMLCARRPVAPGMTQAKFQCEGGRKQKTMQW